MGNSRENRTLLDIGLLKEDLHKNWGWFLVWGIALIIFGVIAISIATFTSLALIITLGILIIISGVVFVIDTFKVWWHKWNGFFPTLIIAILYLVVGIMLLTHPVLGAMSLTLLLGSFYIILGIFRIISSVTLKLPRWGWVLVNGIITLILGLLIVAHWPMWSLFILGLFVGIDMVVTGWTYIMLAMAARMHHA
jgi:uncharacterized membrane protein HdeD (DUF308 family)